MTSLPPHTSKPVPNVTRTIPTLRYDVVLFDLDHTLFDFDQSERLAFRDLAGWAGIDDPAAYDLYRSINAALWRRVESGELDPNDVRERRSSEFLAACNIDLDPEVATQIFVRGLGAHGDLYPGAQDLLDALDGRCRMAMVTNGIGEVQRAKIARLNLDRWFEAYAISGELGHSKPRPEIFSHVLQALDVTDRSTVAMVGDSLTSDIAGGQAAGIDSYWFDRNGTAAQHDARGEFTSLGDLVNLLSV